MSVKLTDLTQATAIAGTDQLYAVVGGSSRRIDASLLGATLLGTVLTTSGSTQSLTSLDLTPYRFLKIAVVGVSTDNASWFLQVDGRQVMATDNASGVQRGFIDIDLTDGTLAANLARAASSSTTASTPYSGDCAITTASTSIDFSTSAGSFDLGAIRVYGIR